MVINIEICFLAFLAENVNLILSLIFFCYGIEAHRWLKNVNEITFHKLVMEYIEGQKRNIS